MKQRVTVTSKRDYVSYLNEMAKETQGSRSEVAGMIIGEYLRDLQRAELVRGAAEFFAQPETPEGVSDRADWEALRLEVCHER